MAAEDCPLCRLAATEGPSVVCVDEHWWAGVLPGFEAPGWLALILRRHAEGAARMDEHEARSFGPMLARLSAAVQQAAGAERVYSMSFGEEITHWHTLLASRMADIPEEQRRAALFAQIGRLRDPQAALVVAERTRELMNSGQ
jgi:diadenosine tetraphosphate (Ap4A) HIT family hydrolase